MGGENTIATSLVAPHKLEALAKRLWPPGEGSVDYVFPLGNDSDELTIRVVLHLLHDIFGSTKILAWQKDLFSIHNFLNCGLQVVGMVAVDGTSSQDDQRWETREMGLLVAIWTPLPMRSDCTTFTACMTTNDVVYFYRKHRKTFRYTDNLYAPSSNTL